MGRYESDITDLLRPVLSVMGRTSIRMEEAMTGKGFLTLMVAVLVSANTAALAQNYPTRPITLIVPFAAGGPTDTIARIVSEWMRALLGQPIIIENVGGAVFYDMGATWGRDPLGTPSLGLLRDFGFGLRLGSSRSARGTVLHIDVAFPLDGDSSVRGVQYLVETKASF